MEEKKIIAYKGFNSDMTCSGYKYEVGKEYTHEGEVKPCESGFHACRNPFDILDHYSDIDGKYCIVEQSGEIVDDINKTSSSKIAIKAEIGFVGLFKYIKELTNPKKIGSSGHSAKIGSSGYYAKIGSSGDNAKIGSSGKHCVICCAGHGCSVKAEVGSWITLAEWSNGKPVCVKTEFVDGERIKAGVYYKLIDGKFTEARV